MPIVTDFKWFDKKRPGNSKSWKVMNEDNGLLKPGEPYNRVGFYMDYMLAKKLDKIPLLLEKRFDAVSIVSGHGDVRVGKSTIALQCAYYVAWLLAGGEMEDDDNSPLYDIEKTTKPLRVKKHPTKKVKFTLDNVVFTPEDLMNKAHELYKKYGRNQVIVYDEGRAGLDSSRAMEAINKIMQDFFQECGRMGHVIFIVLPNFFRLHEDYATSRSWFLVDVFLNEKLDRGFFNFYDKKNKEFLYFNGKKKIGTTLKYTGSMYSFHGRFRDFSPLDEDEYDKAKEAGLKKKQIKTKEVLWKQERDAALALLKRASGWEIDRIASEIQGLVNHRVSSTMIKYAIQNVNKEISED